MSEAISTAWGVLLLTIVGGLTLAVLVIILAALLSVYSVLTGRPTPWERRRR